MSTATDHWFDEIVSEQRMAPMAVRFRLEQMLDNAIIHDDRELWHFEQLVWADEITEDDATELMRALGDRQPRVPDMYAPSQTQLARWIRSFCF